MTLTDQLSAAMRRQYPHGLMRRGAVSEIAGAVGATRQLAHQVAARLGFTVLPKLHPPRLSCHGLCDVCNRLVDDRPSSYCAEHRHLQLICQSCRRTFSRSRERYRRMRSDVRYTANGHQVFCSRTCFGAYRARMLKRGRTLQTGLAMAADGATATHASPANQTSPAQHLSSGRRSDHER